MRKQLFRMGKQPKLKEAAQNLKVQNRLLMDHRLQHTIKKVVGDPAAGNNTDGDYLIDIGVHAEINLA